MEVDVVVGKEGDRCTIAETPLDWIGPWSQHALYFPLIEKLLSESQYFEISKSFRSSDMYLDIFKSGTSFSASGSVSVRN